MYVGIVSIFDNENIGNRLQNYALQQSLLGYSEDALTLKNKHYVSSLSERIKRKSAFAESVIANLAMGKERKAEFLKFNHKHLKVGKTCYWFDRAHDKLKNGDICNLYCAGSDQVWNPNFGRTGMFNYLGFTERERTFSYAASFGIEEIPEQHKEAVRKGLNHIKFISVREDAGKRIVEELTGRTDVQVLVDPTMLLTTEEWDRVAEKPKQGVPEKYLLTYFLGEVSRERRAAVRRKAEEMGCVLIELMDKDSPYYAIGPGHFVYLIKHAALVCTDSFHGSVFSFLYQRPLVIFDREGSGNDMGSRLETLANKFDLRSCMAAGNTLPEVPEQADYSVGYAALEQERQKAKAFLDMVFQEAERAGLCN